MYRALIEATAFGALTIINRFEEYGVKVEQIVNCGGIAEKNPVVMQIYADVTGRPMKISRSAQTCALGAAVAGAVVAGAHQNYTRAQKAMTGVKKQVFKPNPQAHAVYRELYPLYRSAARRLRHTRVEWKPAPRNEETAGDSRASQALGT